MSNRNYTQEELAAGLVSQSFVNESTIKITQMNETCRAWTQSCYLGSFRQIALRIECFVIFRCFGDMGE